jgi:hypothetical protein
MTKYDNVKKSSNNSNNEPAPMAEDDRQYNIGIQASGMCVESDSMGDIMQRITLQLSR